MDNLKALRIVSIVSLATLAIVAFALGFYPLEESARRSGMKVPILLPVLIDLGLVLMSLGAMAARANRLSSWPMRLMAGLLILVSACVQYFHASAQPDVTPVDIVVAVLPPIVLWAASSAVESLLFGRSVKTAVAKAEQDAARAAARTAAKTAPKPSQQVVKPVPTKPEPPKHSKKATPKPSVVEAKQEIEPAPEQAAVETSLSEAKETPAVASKPLRPASPPEASDKPIPLDDLDPAVLDEAIAEVLAGEPLSRVAKKYNVARASLGRRADKARTLVAS